MDGPQPLIHASDRTSAAPAAQIGLSATGLRALIMGGRKVTSCSEPRLIEDPEYPEIVAAAPAIDLSDWLH